jgi:hypothetical protein
VLASRAVHRRAAMVAALLALALPALPAAAEADLELQGELGSGVDTNPRRAAGSGESTDGFAFAQVRARARLAGERLRLAASLAEAVRLYAAAGSATAAASRLDLAARLALGERLSVGASLLASDLTERGHTVDQDLLEGAASLAWASAPYGASLAAGWSAFVPRDAPLRAFRATGPEASLRASWAPAREHVLSAAYGLWAAGYPRWREVASSPRDDRTQTVSAEYAHRGAFAADVGYAFSRNRSTAAGGDFDRHRLTARGAVLLPHQFTVAVRGALQWSRYPDPLFVAQQLLLAQGRESQDALEVRLTHAPGESLELAFALGWYGGETVQGGGSAPGFGRTVATATVGWRGGWHRPRRRPVALRRRPAAPARGIHGPARSTIGTP